MRGDCVLSKQLNLHKFRENRTKLWTILRFIFPAFFHKCINRIRRTQWRRHAITTIHLVACILEIQTDESDSFKIYHVRRATIRFKEKERGAAPFTVLEYLEHCSVHSRTVFSLLNMRATTHCNRH